MAIFLKVTFAQGVALDLNSQGVIRAVGGPELSS
jgi:hypothetical protein